MGQEKANKTMLAALGEAAKLIDNQRFLPMFRNRQMQCDEEQWQKLVSAATDKAKPKEWFAAVCSPKNWQRTLKWLKITAQKIATTVHNITKYFGRTSQKYGDFILNRMAGLSVARQIGLIETARCKREPERYLFKCLSCA